MDGSKIIVHQHEIRRPACHIRSVHPHGNPDICRLQRRCVIHTVPGHRHRLSHRLVSLHDPYLMFRCHSGKYSEFLQTLLEAVLLQVIQFPACNTLIRTVRNAQFPGNGEGSIRMVSRDHDSGHTGSFEVRNRLYRLLSDRILHAEQPQKYHVLLCHTAAGIHGQRQHAPAFRHQFTLHLRDCIPVSLRYIFYGSLPVHPVTSFYDALRCSFGIGDNLLSHPVYGCHHLTLRIKSFFLDSRIPFTQFFNFRPAFICHIKKRQLCRIANLFLPVQNTVITQNTS